MAAKLFVVLSLAVAASAVPLVPVAKVAYAEVEAPAHYEFQYSVHDEHSGDIKQQQEARAGDAVHGSYSLLQPDGLTRVVDYSADKEHGFNAVVRYEGHPAPAPAHPVKLAYAAPVAKLAYAAPVAKVAYSAPVAYAAPVAKVAYSAPVAYAAPVAKVAYAAPVAKVAYSAPVAYAAPVAKVAYSAPVAYAAPVAKVAYAAPVAKVAYSAPVAYAAPVAKVAYSAPVSYAAPVAKVAYAEVEAPAHYEFQYSVHDEHSGDIKQQQEARAGDAVHGSYSLLQPDGLTRVVDYSADKEHGFNAVVRYEGHPAPAPAHPVKLAYAAPVAKLAYAAPVAKVAYSAPVAKVTYANPVAYAAPVAKVAYSAPVSYAAPVAKVAYSAPLGHVTFASPAVSYHH
ncbi:uncharacterized protein LOC135079404 [Ostrinia nubilalis]|uniref:uncharacterized protein LOC135079404 n=1 Tax=Ostrinia nubilalis TaxID=29057 RepID=UPI0030822923